MLEVGHEKLQDEIDLQVKMHTDLVVSVLNSPYGPYLKKGDKYPFQMKNIANQKLEPSEHEKSKRWMAAGDAMMKVVNQHKRETR